MVELRSSDTLTPGGNVPIIALMGLLGKLFGKQKSQPYVDAGMALTFKLCRSLDLPDWKDGLPNYTQEEVAEIDRSLSQFQKMANKEMGGEANFHPDAIPQIQRIMAGEALADFATSRTYSEDIQSNWKSVASTFLKAWASQLAPLTLMKLADLLAEVGHKAEAKEALQVILLFPTYAETLWKKRDDALVAEILQEAKEALNDLE